MELDAGRYDAASTPAILYVVRLVVRVQSFLHCLLRHAVFTGYAKEEEVAQVIGKSGSETNGSTFISAAATSDIRTTTGVGGGPWF
jgi:hypothetical protein